MKLSRERIVVAEGITAATVEVIAVAAVVIAEEIATNASRGGKKALRGNREKGNMEKSDAVSSISSFSPFYLLAAGVSFNFKRSLPRMISTSYS